MNIGILQLKVEENISLNVAKVNELTSKIKNSVILLPELFTTGFNYKVINNLDDNHSDILYELNNDNIYLGSVVRHLNGKRYNSFFIKIGNKIDFIYDKLHLFPLMDEDKHFTQGNRTGVFDIENIKCGASICYDLRFSEIFRNYFKQDIKIVFLPAQWPAIRKEHLIILVKARAIENQCFMVLSNAVGNIWDTIFAGQSMIVSPWGEILVDCGNEIDKFVNFQIDVDLIDEVKNKIPIKESMREDIYGC